MIDTGATTSLISKSELDNIRHSPVKLIKTLATLGDGQTQIPINGIVELSVVIGLLRNFCRFFRIFPEQFRKFWKFPY